MNATATEQAVKVGDIFYTSWGYDQTNVDFYLVIEVSKTGKTLKLRQVSGTTTPESDTNGCAAYDEVVPNSTELAPNFIRSQAEKWCVNCSQFIEIGTYGENKGKLIHRNTDTADCIDVCGNGGPLGTKAKRGKPEIFTKRVKFYDGKPVLGWTSYANAYLWDGKPKYRTGYGYGH